MLKSNNQAEKSNFSRKNVSRKFLFRLKMTLVSMVSMGILIGSYCVPSSSIFVALPWIVFALTGIYVTREFFFYERSEAIKSTRLSPNAEGATSKHFVERRKRRSLEMGSSR